MKITLQKAEIEKAINFTQGIIDKRTTNPILSNILFSASDDKLELYSTNMDISSINQIGANVETAGRAVVSAKMLFDIIRKFPPGEIQMRRMDNNWLELKSSSVQYKIAGLHPEEYPTIEKPKKSDYITIKSKVLLKLLRKTLFAVSTEDVKKILGGILFDFSEENYMKLVATDGHRLALVREPANMKIKKKGDSSVVLPRKGMQELQKILEETDEDIKVSIDEKMAVFRTETKTLMMKVLEGSFPDYNQVMPRENDKILRINRQRFYDALSRMVIVSAERSNIVRISFSEEGIVVSSESPNEGEGKEFVEAEYKGTKMDMGFNARFIMDIMEVADEEIIEMKLLDELSAVLVKPAQDENFLNVVMPVRMP
ncbi:MAG: DNA polymerase III subunit beta [Deltaproteobacteria bacterium]|nr:DNA polymerase III subunit beta [Deltaproteobacteria bacterium]